jgi:hypothetical protein
MVLHATPNLVVRLVRGHAYAFDTYVTVYLSVSGGYRHGTTLASSAYLNMSGPLYGAVVHSLTIH